MKRAEIALAAALLLLAPSARAGEQAAPSLTFDEATQRALASHPTIASVDAELRRTRALVDEARAGWMPTLYGNAIYTRLDDDRLLSGRVVSARDQLSANLLLTVPIVYPQRWARESQAKLDVEAARTAAIDARRQLAATVGRACLLVQSQARSLDVAKRAQATAQAHAEFSTTRFQGGVGNRLDVVRANVEASSTAAQVEAARLGLAKAREALGALVGTDGPLDCAGSVVATRDASAAAVDDAAKKRSDVVARRARVASAERVVADRWADYAPQLAGTFQPFYQNPPSLVQPLTGWQAQAVLSVPLYDGGLRYGLDRERRARLDQARADLDATTRQVRSDVRAAAETWDRAQATLGLTQTTAAQAREALELVSSAFRAGATTSLEVVDAERKAEDAETQVVLQEFLLEQAKLDWLVATGKFP